jgi:Recombinase zinc beta ribbon domain
MAHEPLVTPELFARANRTKGTRHASPSDGYLLTGLVRCSGCGSAMAHQQRDDGRYWRCRSAQHGDGRCAKPANVPADQLDEFVVAGLSY